jgi:hypothetical protein
MVRLRFLGRAVLAVPFLILVSCGGSKPKLHPVHGSVLFLNQPADGAVVVFQPLNSGPESTMPSGTVGADGSFTLRTAPHGDGAPAGEYVVLVTWYPPDAREKINPQNKLPARYGIPTESPLRATVNPGTNQLEPYRLTK